MFSSATVMVLWVSLGKISCRHNPWLRLFSALASENTFQTLVLGFETVLCFHDHNKDLYNCDEIFVFVCNSDDV